MMRELVYMPRLFGQPLYPNGFPLYYRGEGWHGNVKEMLLEAVTKYYNLQTGHEPGPTEEDVALIIEFLEYYINAPIWKANPFNTDPIESLQQKAEKMHTINDIETFIGDCLEIGLDPL